MFFSGEMTAAGMLSVAGLLGLSVLLVLLPAVLARKEKSAGLWRAAAWTALGLWAFFAASLSLDAGSVGFVFSVYGLFWVARLVALIGLVAGVARWISANGIRTLLPWLSVLTLATVAAFSPVLTVPLLEALRAASVPGGIYAFMAACVALSFAPVLAVRDREAKKRWMPAGILGSLLVGIAALLTAAAQGRADYVTPLAYPLVAPALALGLGGALITLLARHESPDDSTESRMRRFSVLGVLVVCAGALLATAPAYNTMQLCRFQRTVADLALTAEVPQGVSIETLESEFAAALQLVVDQKDEASKDAYRELRLRRWHPSAVLAGTGYRNTYFDGTGSVFKYPEHDPGKLKPLARNLFLERGSVPSRALYIRRVPGGVVRVADVRNATLDDLPYGYRKSTRAVTWNCCVPGLRRARQVELFSGQLVRAIVLEYGTPGAAEVVAVVYVVSTDGEEWHVIGTGEAPPT